MKVPPKRKGNLGSACILGEVAERSLNESPSQKEGKFKAEVLDAHTYRGLNESPSQKEGKFLDGFFLNRFVVSASMKVPPKRKGNFQPVFIYSVI